MAPDAPPFRSLLYTEPRLYDLAFPADTVTPMCLQACRRFLRRASAMRSPTRTSCARCSSARASPAGSRPPVTSAALGGRKLYAVAERR